MIPKSLLSITEADLRALIENQIPESKTLEFKRELPGASHDEKIKFLRAISAFANTESGDLIYGIEAINGVPVNLTGFTNSTADEVVLRLTSLCRDAIEPRVPGINFMPIELQSGGWVLIVRINKSWNAPHRVTLAGHGHFYGRSSAGAYQLDVGELKTAFTLSDAIAERIRGFRASRLMSIKAGDTPVQMQSDVAKIVLHVLPLSSFTGGDSLDFNSAYPNLTNLQPIFSGGYNNKINLDGVVTYDFSDTASSAFYVQAYRSGVIEAVSVIRTLHGQKILAGAYETRVTHSLDYYLKHIAAHEINPPIYVFMSLLNVDGYRFDGGVTGGVSDRPEMSFPEATIESYGLTANDIMLPTFKLVCNAFGFIRPDD